MSIFSGEENFFGIDLGTSGVRVVQLKNTHGKPSLLTYGDIEAPNNLIASDAPADQEKMAEIVRKIADDAGVSTKVAVTAIPTQSVFATTIKTPKLSDAELASSIHLHADKYIPMPIDQVKIDYVVLNDGSVDGKKPADDSNVEMEVFLVAAPNIVTTKYLNIIQKAGFELLALEVSPIALVRSLVPQDATGGVLIADFGASATDITIAVAGKPRLIRSVNVGSHSVVRIAAQNLGLDEAQAMQFIQKFGLTQDKLEGQVYKSVKPAIDNLFSEISKSIKYFQTSDPGHTVDKIIITGRMTTMPEFPLYLANTVGLTVEIGNPWLNVSYPSSLADKLNTVSLNYATAIGLAMREMG